MSAGGLDLRLAGVALGAWLASWLALRLPWEAAVATALTAAVCCVVLWRSRLAAMPAIALIAVLLGIVCGSVATAGRTAVRDSPEISLLNRQRATVAVVLKITDDPRLTRTGRGYLIAADLTRAGRLTLDAKVTLMAGGDGWSALLPGQRLRAVAVFAFPRGGDLRAATLTMRGPPELIGSPPWYQRGTGSLRAGLQTASGSISGPAGGLLPGLVIGDTSRLDAALADDFRATGMTHLVAVSGANCAIVLACVVFLARWARAGPRLTATLGVVALVGFVLLARPSPSVLRAAVMGVIGLIGLASGRPRAALPALAGAVFVLIVVDPGLSGDMGFALSVTATAGLLLLAPGWRDALRRWGLPAGVAEAVAVPAAAQVACGPLIAMLSASVSLVAIPANFLVGPAVAPATLLGVGAAAISPLWPEGASVLAWLAGWAARWLVTVAHIGAEVPSGVVPWPGGVLGGCLLAAVTVLVLGVVRFPVARRIVIAAIVGVALGVVPMRLLATGWPPPGWVLAACDVGQGDALVVSAGDGAAVVVDAGPDPRLVDACMADLGVTRVPLLVVSHYHADHVDGLPGVLSGRSLTAVLVPDVAEPPAGYQFVATVVARSGVSLTVPVPGAVYRVGAVLLEVLGPTRRLVGTRSDANENSLIVRATVNGITVLLTGDAETEEQRTLSRSDLRADILKVAHHGSAFQDDDFLAAVDPALALVSVGAGNRYGHPHPPLLDKLRRAGARVMRTDRDGEIAVAGRPGALTVTCRTTRRTR